MKRNATFILFFFAAILTAHALFAQAPADGENNFFLSAVNPRILGAPDTIDCDAGRGLFVADNPDLDGDGKPEIMVTDYRDGGRVYVFEVIGDNKMEFVWGSKRLNPGHSGGGQTPRSISVGDFDNNGRQEIIFQIGYFANDSLQFAQRGIYFYEFTGNDNDYGEEPIFKMEFADIDTNFNTRNTGRGEEPIFVGDVDNDGKSELFFAPRSFSFAVANLYILEVESGTFAGGDASIKVEYKYEDMATFLSNGQDGYVPTNAIAGNVDADANIEIVVLGWTNIQRGGGVGFIEVAGPDSYTNGNIVPLASTANLWNVKGQAAIVEGAGGQPALIIAGGSSSNGIQRIFVADNILSDAFVSETDFKPILESEIQWGVMAVGDQDHGSGADGFDIYYGISSEIRSLEYNGSGALSDPNSYTNHGRLGGFNLDDAYDVSDGLFNHLFTFPGMDLDRDGNREVIASYKGGCGGPADSLDGTTFIQNTFNIFVFEWGDSTNSIELSLTTDVKDPREWTVIIPEDYTLEQNYPNPFNPVTTIHFSLPVNKKISLTIYNTLGQAVRTLIDNVEHAQGTHRVVWDGKDDFGRSMASGTYVYKLEFGNFSKTKTMTLLK